MLKIIYLPISDLYVSLRNDDIVYESTNRDEVVQLQRISSRDNKDSPNKDIYTQRQKYRDDRNNKSDGSYSNYDINGEEKHELD